MGKEVVSPLVSIICNTYNHVNYIRQCLDGFLMQETNFPIEILVHDDASTDGTADIVREYEDKYPDLIKPIYQTENQYSKGVKVSLKYQYSRAKGKYIALCEGDDYWTDPLKLQKQVDLLENNHEFVMCSHFRELYHQEYNNFSFSENLTYVEYDLNNLIVGDWFYQPVTVVFRNIVSDLLLDKHTINTDVVLYYHLLQQGKGVCLPEVMAVYRLHNGGVWSLVDQGEKWRQEFIVRLDICKVEDTVDSARFLYNQLTKQISRKWLLKNYRITFMTMLLLYRKLPRRLFIKMLFVKFILNKPLSVI